MHILDELAARGMLQDVSNLDGIKALPKGEYFYVGFDPTAESLHFGHLIPMFTAMRLAQYGYKPILLFGGATGTIGDPREKGERSVLTIEQVRSFVESISKKVKEIFQRKGVEATIVNNYDWSHDIKVLDFLRDIGKHFTVNYMIAKDTIKSRLSGEGISFTEFSYQLLQSNDFMHLHKTYGCRLQFGGSDQWGNMTSGIELIRRKMQTEVFGFSLRLLLDKNGQKFGKSVGGEKIWLNAELTSPYKMHQYWLNVADEDVIKLLKWFTFLSLDEIAELEKKAKEEPEKREAQKVLADIVCSLVHGEQATHDAKKSAEVLFGGSIEGLSDFQLEEIFSEVPSSTISKDEVSGISACDIFVKSGLVKSKGEARRLITGGGAYINSQRITDENSLAKDYLKDSSLLILRSGKKNYHLMKVGAIRVP